MRAIIFISLSFFFWLSSSGFAADCQPERGNCAYYSCLESRYNCGSSGYLEEYGLRNCTNFLTEYFAEFEPKTQAWLGDVSFCLQESLAAAQPQDSCAAVERTAIGTHATCYESTGFCELPRSERNKVIDRLELDLLNPYIWEEMVKILNICGLK